MNAQQSFPHSKHHPLGDASLAAAWSKQSVVGTINGYHMSYKTPAGLKCRLESQHTIDHAMNGRCPCQSSCLHACRIDTWCLDCRQIRCIVALKTAQAYTICLCARLGVSLISRISSASTHFQKSKLLINLARIRRSAQVITWGVAKHQRLLTNLCRDSSDKQGSKECLELISAEKKPSS